MGILAGALFTGLIQSSAATMGIAIVMASEGLVTLPAGIAPALERLRLETAMVELGHLMVDKDLHASDTMKLALTGLGETGGAGRGCCRWVGGRE